ncbi:hypothetical protein BU16DRAFT_262894 [Lophium mytilinum]|uniref:RING-type domain-containing protein n=1 Tax=Lophium mytilinum TaxID=390894 RepID=A0A6A6R6R8_9PEZI|nr:hypothetical protein BU16DRAFT_262894 [Lophium mytilinum]
MASNTKPRRLSSAQNTPGIGLKAPPKKKPEEAPTPSKTEEQLNSYKSDFDSLRTHVTCKICDRLFYEPYIISCGHTYCYSCLCTWFVSNKVKKTCPDCRTVVTQAPAPAYVLRDMTHIFINRAELLPAGETLEQHKQWQKEEADIVQRDKVNTDSRTGGLFKGCFKQRPSDRLRIIRDEEDGIERCPRCAWELEGGECAGCGAMFDDNGEITWGDSFGGFSDMDELSEHDMSGEDLDAELEMDDEGNVWDPYDEELGAWGQGYPDDDQSFMMQRFLAAGGIPRRMPQRRLTHSEAGSRRPSYSASIVSDMLTEEMDTVEEEDEEDYDEDSSMNDFIEDDEGGSLGTASTASQTPQPQPPPNRQQRNRRILESEASSDMSQSTEEDDEDEGPIIPAGRRRQQARVLNRANGTRQAPSSTSTEASAHHELDEDTQALLQAAGWSPLAHDGPDEEMEDDDDSDGGRTTVGWEPTAISNDRARIGGSLTPTADRPRPNAPIRPPSRTGNNRLLDGSRGLRRRSSVLSNATVTYEDGEADDDDSDMDRDGDITMSSNTLRPRQSRVQMRTGSLSNNSTSRFANRGTSQTDAIELDTDDNSDTSQQAQRRRGTARARQQEYDPRISWMFASHLADLRETERVGAPYDYLEQLRSTTPIARPRTANRNRNSAQASPAPPFSPFSIPRAAPARLRTPSMDNSLNGGVAVRGSPSQASRSGFTPNLSSASEVVGRNSSIPVERATSIASTGSSSGQLTPASSVRSASQSSVNSISQAATAASVDMIDRPPSRVSSRPTFGAGRGSAGLSPSFPGLSTPGVGLNFGARMFGNPTQPLRNPWATYVNSGPQGVVRNRPSRTALRDQSSVATLRASNSRRGLREQASRVNIHDGGNSPQTMRPRESRQNLRPQASSRRLNNQASTRTLRASDLARPPSQPPSPGIAPTPAVRPRLTEDERLSLARELVNNRARELGTYQPGTAQTQTRNPFTAGARRPSQSLPTRDTNSAPAETAPSSALPAPMHSRSNSNESITSVRSNPTHQPASSPQQPTLGRRRSNRNIGAPPGAFAPPQSAFAPPPNAYGAFARRGSAGLAGYENPIAAGVGVGGGGAGVGGVGTRGVSPMQVVGAGDRRAY